MEAAGRLLAGFSASADWSALPFHLRTKVVDHVIDTVGVMYSGAQVELSSGARRAVLLWGSGDEALAIGLDSRHPPAGAAFLNALHARIQTFDDTYEPGTMHTGSPVVSAALALSEEHAVDGREFLSAVIAGYEVSCRVAAAVSPSHYASGFHNTGTCTVFGATAAASRILRLDAVATAEAFGLAGATAAGLRQHQIDGSMLDTAFHGARAAQSGVMVAQLRAEGIRGPAAILEGPMGFCHVMAPEQDTGRLVSGLGSEYEFAKTTIKPYPSCRFAHGPTEVMLELRRRHRIDPAGVEEVVLETFRQSMDVSDRADIRSSLDAAASHQYAMALALLKPDVEVCDSRHYQVPDREAMAFMGKIRVLHDAELEKDFPRSWPHRVTVLMKNGERHAMLSEYPPGRLTPPSREAVDAKFLSQGTAFLGEARARQALEALRSIDGHPDMRELTRMLERQ